MKIDLMVYKLYELTWDEALLVDPEYAARHYFAGGLRKGGGRRVGGVENMKIKFMI